MQHTSYTIERSKRRSITLTIKPDKTILVKAPYLVPKPIIDAFVRKHEEWIDKRLQKLADIPHHSSGNYQDGDTFLYMGKVVTFTLGAYTSITVVGDKLYFPKALQFRAQKELMEWYRRQAEAMITDQTEKYAKQMNTSYIGLTFSDTKSRWGSCTHDNALQFNWRLIMAPPLVMNYVIVHELAHTMEKNHSRSFWSKVGLYNPSYRQNRKWLKDNGHTLVF